MAKKVKTRIHDYTAPEIGALIIERNKLMISKENPERLKAIISRLNYIDWGIK